MPREFADVVAELRATAERQHRQGLLYGAVVADGKPPTGKQLDAAMADWVPPSQEVLEQQAAQFLAAEAAHADYVTGRAEAARDAAVRKRERAEEQVEAARAAEAQQEQDYQAARAAADEAHALLADLPEHLRQAAPPGDTTTARAETADGSGAAGEG